MTKTDVKHAAWEATKVAGTALWVIIRICIIVIVAVVIGTIRGAARSKTKSVS